MFIFYDGVFLLYALFYLPYLIVTRRAYKGFSMRWGSFAQQIKQQIKAKPNIWLHAVSVGEVMVLEGFIDQLNKIYPQYQLIVSVTTKTGFGLAQERLKNKAVVIASPLDFSFTVEHFISLINPKMYIAVETEIWPNLYEQLNKHQIPAMIINGRISDRSFGRYKAIRFLLKGILHHVQLFCMQSQMDAQRIIDLGANPQKVVVTGNMKFDGCDEKIGTSPDFQIKESGDVPIFWWVAGSTHPGEEEIILDVYKDILQSNPGWRVIIVPRHIERVSTIIELIKAKGMKTIKFSEIDGSSMTIFKDDIMVVDTIGHLRSLYEIASLVFVGKSLCVGGGHNIIEPAFFAKPIVIGPKVENFRDIVACFKKAQAVKQVSDKYDFSKVIKELVADPVKRAELGAAAKEVIQQNQGATKRTLEYLTKICHPEPKAKDLKGT